MVGLHCLATTGKWAGDPVQRTYDTSLVGVRGAELWKEGRNGARLTGALVRPSAEKWHGRAFSSTRPLAVQRRGTEGDAEEVKIAGPGVVVLESRC